MSRHPTRIRIDAGRWIETLLCPDVPQDAGDGAWGVVVVDNKGRRGSRFGTRTYFFQPRIELFRDTDGERYAFIMGNHRAESSFVVAIRGRQLVQLAECYARYEADCQPLPGGGALIIQWTRDIESVPDTHEDDSVAQVSRFRNGKLTKLGLIFLPLQK